MSNPFVTRIEAALKNPAEARGRDVLVNHQDLYDLLHRFLRLDKEVRTAYESAKASEQPVDFTERNIDEVISLLHKRHRPFTDTDFTRELAVLYNAKVHSTKRVMRGD